MPPPRPPAIRHISAVSSPAVSARYRSSSARRGRQSLIRVHRSSIRWECVAILYEPLARATSQLHGSPGNTNISWSAQSRTFNCPLQIGQYLSQSHRSSLFSHCEQTICRSAAIVALAKTVPERFTLSKLAVAYISQITTFDTRISAVALDFHFTQQPRAHIVYKSTHYNGLWNPWVTLQLLELVTNVLFDEISGTRRKTRKRHSRGPGPILDSRPQILFARVHQSDSPCD